MDCLYDGHKVVYATRTAKGLSMLSVLMWYARHTHHTCVGLRYTCKLIRPYSALGLVPFRVIELLFWFGALMS